MFCEICETGKNLMYSKTLIKGEWKTICWKCKLSIGRIKTKEKANDKDIQMSNLKPL